MVKLAQPTKPREEQRAFYVILYVTFCVSGTLFELAYGALWSVVGTAPWIYPSSPMYYTSLAVLPLWGCVGLIGISIYHTLLHKKLKFMRVALIAMVAAALYVIAYSLLV